MREAARNLTPGGIALRLQQRRDIVEHDNVTCGVIFVSGQRGAGASQHAPADFAAQDDLFPPFGLAGIEMHAGDIDQLLQQGLSFCHLGQVFSHPVFQIDVQDGAGSLVGGSDPQV